MNNPVSNAVNNPAIGTSDNPVATAYVDVIAASIRGVLAGEPVPVPGGIDGSTVTYCRSCARPVASDTDWDRYDGGDGGHLCWEPPGRCPWEFADLDLAVRVAEQVAALMGLKVEPRGVPTPVPHTMSA